METPNWVLRRRRRGEKGFTLIELLVVIAVLAILAAIVLFNVVGVTNRGKSSACATDVKTVQTAADAYLNDHTGDQSAALPAGTIKDSWGGWTALVPAYVHTAPNAGTDGKAECTVTPLSLTYINGTDTTGGVTVAGSGT